MQIDDDFDGYVPEKEVVRTSRRRLSCRQCEAILDEQYVLVVGRICQRCWDKRGAAIPTRHEVAWRWEMVG